MNKKEILRGIREVTPLLLGVVPMGVSVGIFSVENGFSVLQSMAMSIFIFAGAAQVATVDLLTNNASIWVIVVTAALINIRFLIYGASISPYLQKAKTTLKIFLSYILTDMAFIVPSYAHHLSKRLESFLEFIPVSATAAIAMSSLVYNGSSDSYIFSPERLIAGIIAFAVAYFSKSVIATFIIGMGVLWVLQAYEI